MEDKLKKAIIEIVDERIDERLKNITITIEDKTSTSLQDIEELLSSLNYHPAKILK